MAKTLRIFLAHASEDKSRVRQLYDKLKDKGFKPWLDKIDLLPGQNWRIEIPKAIRESDIFLACLSKRTVKKSGYINKELLIALDEYSERPNDKIFLIPVKLDDCQVPEVEIPELGTNLTHFQWVELWEEDGFQRLIKAIESLIEVDQVVEAATPSKPKILINPTIKLLFSGLQAFFFDRENTSCRVGIHNQAPNHRLFLKVRMLYSGSERSIDLSEAASGYDIRLNVVNPKMKGVEVYSNGRFDRNSAENDPQDFRWAIGIRSSEFHGEVPIDHSVLQPSFYTNNGLFHTHNRIRARILRRRDRTDRVVEVAEHIGANIDLEDDDSEAILTFGMNGKQGLRLKKEPNTRYEITVSNDCPPSLGADSDFKLYYKAFLVAEDDQFDLTGAYRVDKGSKGKRALVSSYSPCVPVCGDGYF